MYRIAILGCENSHADAFLKSIITDKKYTDIDVVGVYSNEEDACERMRTNFGVYCAKSYDEFVGKVDGIMITARDGMNHYKYAKPYIESGIPMFIDKPIASDEDEAVEFMKDLKSHGCRVTGGSTCPYAPLVCDLADATGDGVLGGFLRAPISIENNYGGIFFYAQHLAEVMMKIFGYFPKSVKAYKNGSVISATVRYENYDVMAEYTDGCYTYAAYVSKKTGMVGGEYPVDGSLYPHELASFYALLKGGKGKEDLRAFISPVYFIAAMIRSLETGNEESIKEIPEI